MKPDNASFLRARGLCRHHQGEYDKAVKDFAESARLNSKDSYAVILGPASTARKVGDEALAKRFLSNSAGKLDEAWPHAVVRYLRGEIDEAAVMSSATDDDKRTEAHCYLGMDHDLKGHGGDISRC